MSMHQTRTGSSDRVCDHTCRLVRGTGSSDRVCDHTCGDLHGTSSSDRVCGRTCRLLRGTCTSECIRGSIACRHLSGTSSGASASCDKEEYCEDDALEKGIQQAEEERAIKADLMARVWNKKLEHCQCGRSLPSPVDGQGDCRNCGCSVEGRKILRCRDCSIVLCPRCSIGAKWGDLGYDARQIEEMGTSCVYVVMSAKHAPDPLCPQDKESVERLAATGVHADLVKLVRKKPLLAGRGSSLWVGLHPSSLWVGPHQ